MVRKILHLDLDAFFCAVEELRDASLRGKAFAVGGRPDQRGVVSSCSYAARKFGVRSAMPMAVALRQCPGLIVVSPHFRAYSVASRQVMQRLRQLTPLVEQISIDEAFMDVSALPGEAEALARQLQAQIHAELSLPCSLGVAANKLVAKIATDVGKLRARQAGVSGSPNAVTVVPPGTEAEFLAGLPVEMLWGVGPKTAERLERELHIRTIGDLAGQPPAELARLFGKNGWELAERARGIDDRPLEMERQAKSISQERTFARDLTDRQELLDTLQRLSQKVAESLHKHALSGVTVKIKLRWPDFTTITRQVTLPQPAQEAELIFSTAQALFEREWQPSRAVRLIGVGVSGLEAKPLQLGLWDEQVQKDRRLEDAIEDLQQRYGKAAPKRGLKSGS